MKDMDTTEQNNKNILDIHKNKEKINKKVKKTFIDCKRELLMSCFFKTKLSHY